jgi:hypothetical protein
MVTTISSLRPRATREISRPSSLTRFAIRAAEYALAFAMAMLAEPR